MDFQEEFQERIEKKEIEIAKKEEPKSLPSVSLEDVKFKLNTDQSFEKQAEDVAMAMATAKAVNDESTAEMLSTAKKSELVSGATERVKKAQKNVIEAETDIQKAKRDRYHLLFDTFGVSDHVPDWLLKALMVIFAPFYVFYVIIIGIPTGFIRFLIDCIDGILVRYDKAEDQRKPKIKVTVWILLSLIIVGAVCITILACLHII